MIASKPVIHSPLKIDAFASTHFSMGENSIWHKLSSRLVYPGVPRRVYCKAGGGSNVLILGSRLFTWDYLNLIRSLVDLG